MLGIRKDYLVAGYEDVFYWLWKEGTIPDNLDPLKADLKDPADRRALAQALEKGLGTPVGYALPLKWDEKKSTWKSSPWDFRREQMFLIPGDSAMGMRLPLDSLPWVAPDKREPFFEQDQFAELPPLEDYHEQDRRLDSCHGRS